MYNVDFVKDQIDELKKYATSLMLALWQVAKLCVGWAYVFGARGEECTPANRRLYFSRKGDEHPTIKTACKNFDGAGTCAGCKYYPNGRSRFFDCRGFVYWLFLMVYGFKIEGSGCTSQWNTETNWKAKGTIDTVPENVVVCLFKQDKTKSKFTMAHVGIGYMGETVECSSGVQYFKTRNKKWTHWAVPACVEEYDGQQPAQPTETVKDDKPVSKPTLKKGSKGQAVKELQEKLISMGYSCGSYGADGDFGSATLAAVKAFQKDRGLTVDGIVGTNTYKALDGAQPVQKYSATIPHLTKAQADTLVSQYPGTVINEERGNG